MAILGTDRDQLGYKQEDGTIQLRNFVESTIISQSPDIDRVTRYYLYWNFYNGKHWRQYNETFLSFNYIKAFIDKIINFVLGKDGCSFAVSSYDNSDLKQDDETAIEGFVEYTWNRNRKKTILYEMLQMGSVTGDCWVHCGWDKDKEFVPLSVLDSRHCFPEFEMGDVNKLNKFVIRQPLMQNENHYLVFVSEYTKDTLTTWYQRDTAKEGQRIEEFDKPNELGFIPIVHIKNKPYSEGYYSRSDMADILKINKTYNELSQQIKTIIDYYGTPTTVITGASVKMLRRGVGNIWSGLPAEANVFNLALGEDLGSSIQFLEKLKLGMHELSDVPENALGKLQSISNTSASALQVTYQPLIQQADLKWMTYGDGISEINTMISRIFSKVSPNDKRFKKCPKDFWELYTINPVFTYGLPQDRMVQLNEANMELNMKIGSRREIMNRLGKKNVPELIKEADEDAKKAQELLGMGGSSQEEIPPINPKSVEQSSTRPIKNSNQ